MHSDPVTPPATPSVTPEAIESAIRVLQAIVGDRLLLNQMSSEKRRELLMAAGRASRPERLEIMKMSKAHRRARKRKEREEDRLARAGSEIREARREAVFVPPPRRTEKEKAGREKRVLRNSRQCYVCKVQYRELHFFYDAMCERCGDFNYAKRFQTASLEGRVALITGARVKIGFQSALMLLRAGARVIVTTRFPNDAALRFSREADFAEWGDRLHVYGLDLRHSLSVELFARFVGARYERLDFLINNAAQTVRRPPGFYSHLLDFEVRPVGELPAALRPILADYERCKGTLALHRAEGGGEAAALARRTGTLGVGLQSPARLSQVAWMEEEASYGTDVFPLGKCDADLQQIDLRSINSWRLTMGQVATPEMIEVQLVNSIAPFILCSRLKPLLLRHVTGDKHVVNVSAMEGKFSRHTKTDKHPHTNMAKAALNMMTLTSAPDYAKDGIYMNAVDTGWVTDEDPVHLSQRKQHEHDFQPPLDIVDGAARVCDPIFAGFLTGRHVWGKFLKDYHPTEW